MPQSPWAFLGLGEQSYGAVSYKYLYKNIYLKINLRIMDSKNDLKINANCQYI